MKRGSPGEQPYQGDLDQWTRFTKENSRSWTRKSTCMHIVKDQTLSKESEKLVVRRRLKFRNTYEKMLS